MTSAAPSTLVPGRVRGFRLLRLEESGLRSPYAVGAPAWREGRARAVCHRGSGHLVPSPMCSCGLYAWYRPGEAELRAGPGEVVVAVEAYGPVVLGEHGWRAERAEVVAVLLPPRARTSPAVRRRVETLVAVHAPRAALVVSGRELRRRFAVEEMSALGVAARPTPLAAHGPRWTAGWVAGLAVLYGGVVTAATTEAVPRAIQRGGWVLALVLLLVWQGWLLARGARASAGNG